MHSLTPPPHGDRIHSKTPPPQLWASTVLQLVPQVVSIVRFYCTSTGLTGGLNYELLLYFNWSHRWSQLWAFYCTSTGPIRRWSQLWTFHLKALLCTQIHLHIHKSKPDKSTTVSTLLITVASYVSTYYPVRSVVWYAFGLQSLLQTPPQPWPQDICLCMHLVDSVCSVYFDGI